MWQRFALLVLLFPCAAAAQGVLAGKILSYSPNGDGDPLQVVCRPPQPLPGQRLMGPEVCKTNAVWAWYRQQGLDIAADGVHDVAGRKAAADRPGPCVNRPQGVQVTSSYSEATFSTLCN